ncbi:MAG TPA: glycoside hydrolase family 140 protein [Prolixibacteraceae bacterium]|nr:glycoside hydrolase family 140 protein [Prolixibacteraceae bacterium]
MNKQIHLFFILAFVAFLGSCTNEKERSTLPLLRVSENHRYLETENGDPFFWLGDTGWLLFSKLNREEADIYLSDRKEKGFNVIQVMVLHELEVKNPYGDFALVNKNVAEPLTTEGCNYSDTLEYDFWDHVDYIIDLAAEKGIFMALVPVWGSNVKSGHVSVEQAEVYAKWLANRYRDRSNIIWLNGGDIKGEDSINVWKTIGETINSVDQNHLITFHPRGRYSSSTWFHNENWLDFNMFQSGHRRYDQDDTEWNYGEDNWRHVAHDLSMSPPKPTIDGEPSYEGIPQGLHDTTQPYWNDADARRYAYWSVFAGAFGHTYGHSAIMQFYRPEDNEAAYGARIYWTEAKDAPGAAQMRYLKELMLSHSYADRIPDQSIIAGETGEKYNRLIATQGENFALIYAFSGGEIPVAMENVKGEKIKASWFNPQTGEKTEIGTVENTGGIRLFSCPGEKIPGNDWVLILERTT